MISRVSLVALRVLEISVAVSGIVAFLATYVAAICSSSAFSQMLLPTFLASRSVVVVRGISLLRKTLLVPLLSLVPLPLLLASAKLPVVAVLTRRSSWTFLLRSLIRSCLNLLRLTQNLG